MSILLPYITKILFLKYKTNKLYYNRIWQQACLEEWKVFCFEETHKYKFTLKKIFCDFRRRFESLEVESRTAFSVLCTAVLLSSDWKPVPFLQWFKNEYLYLWVIFLTEDYALFEVSLLCYSNSSTTKTWRIFCLSPQS